MAKYKQNEMFSGLTGHSKNSEYYFRNDKNGLTILAKKPEVTNRERTEQQQFVSRCFIAATKKATEIVKNESQYADWESAWQKKDKPKQKTVRGFITSTYFGWYKEGRLSIPDDLTPDSMKSLEDKYLK